MTMDTKNPYSEEDVEFVRALVRKSRDLYLEIGDRLLLFLPIRSGGDQIRESQVMEDFAEEVGLAANTLMTYRRVSAFVTRARRHELRKFKSIHYPFSVLKEAQRTTRGNLSADARWAALILLLEKAKGSYQKRVTVEEYLNSLGAAPEEARDILDHTQSALPLFEAARSDEAMEILRTTVPNWRELCRAELNFKPRTEYAPKPVKKAERETRVAAMSSQQLFEEMNRTTLAFQEQVQELQQRADAGLLSARERDEAREMMDDMLSWMKALMEKALGASV